MAFVSNGTTILDAGAFSASLGAMVHIKTLTASSSSTLSFVDGASSVVFDNTYPIYKFEFINIHAGTDQANFQFNGSVNSGSAYNTTKTSNFYYSYNRGSDGANNFQYDNNRDLAQGTGVARISGDLYTDNDSSMSGEMFLFSPSSTTFMKHFISNTQRMDYSSGGYSNTWKSAGYTNTTSAVNAIQFSMVTGNIDSGTIKLYGIKDS